MRVDRYKVFNKDPSVWLDGARSLIAHPLD